MPTYVYACKSCEHRFEQYQSFSEDSLVTCPECAQDALRKVFDSVGIVFKGPGFYSTDSARSPSSASSNSNSSDSSDSAGSSADSSSADKSAATSDSGSSASSGSEAGSSSGSTSSAQPAAAAS